MSLTLWKSPRLKFQIGREAHANVGSCVSAYSCDHGSHGRLRPYPRLELKLYLFPYLCLSSCLFLGELTRCGPPPRLALLPPGASIEDSCMALSFLCSSLSTLTSPARGSVVAQPQSSKNASRCPPTRTAASAPPRCSALLGSHSRSPRVVVEEERDILVES